MFGPPAYLMVLPMKQEMDCDEVIVVGRRAHVEQEAMDAVLDEGPHEHPNQEEERETVLVDQEGVLWRYTGTKTTCNQKTYIKPSCTHNCCFKLQDM